ncbi:MAG: DUF86 domain-containing protein [Desulfomonilaceae bacterium]
MRHRDVAHLIDILGAARLIQAFIQGVDQQTFNKDVMLQSAVIRQIEIMGEATKRLSEDFKRAQPHIPWRKVAGMRDILIHAYDFVDLGEVWNAVTTSIPDTVRKIEELIPQDAESE